MDHLEAVTSGMGGHLQALRAQLVGRFEIVRLLGRGGMGEVYLAREKSLDRSVALKVFPITSNVGAQARERFRREARMAGRLSHPGIVPLYSYEELDEFFYFVMGFVDGESLDAKIAREGYISSDEVRRIATAVLDALAYAHRKGFVHRDIKPANILLEEATGRVLLADFGVARSAGAHVIAADSPDAYHGKAALTDTADILGTPFYMAPEQWSGKPVDARSDIYSLGVTIYEAATGVHPHSGITPGQLTEAPERWLIPRQPSSVRSTISPSLDRAVRLCLALDPNDRPATADVLLEMLSDQSDVQLRTGRVSRILAGGATSLPRRWVAIIGGGWFVSSLMLVAAQIDLVPTSWFDILFPVWLFVIMAGLWFEGRRAFMGRIGKDPKPTVASVVVGLWIAMAGVAVVFAIISNIF
jgi:serine/threonine protein kinase